MGYRITGVSPKPFEHLYGLSNDDLALQGARRYTVDEKPGFPDRISLRDVEIGDRVLLVNFTHQSAPTPYQSSHAIFVREGERDVAVVVDRVPESLQLRTLSLRAFDTDGMMVDADLVEGRAAESLIHKFFGNQQVAYIHAHYARRGCFSARIDRN